jgi:hypothetical protein
MPQRSGLKCAHHLSSTAISQAEVEDFNLELDEDIGSDGFKILDPAPIGPVKGMSGEEVDNFLVFDYFPAV